MSYFMLGAHIGAAISVLFLETPIVLAACFMAFLWMGYISGVGNERNKVG